MALQRRREFIKAALLICLALFFHEAQARASRGLVHRAVVYDVRKYGAMGDGKLVVNEDGDPVNNVAFVRAWRGACDSDGPAKVVIPLGRFVISQVLFAGPCRNPNPIIELQGTVVASKDFSQYTSPEWFLFERVDGVSVIGSGTFEGQGKVNWKSIDCKHNENCIHLPKTLKIRGAAKGVANTIQAIGAIHTHFKVRG